MLNNLVISKKVFSLTSLGCYFREAIIYFLFSFFILFFAVLCIRYNDTGVPVLCYHQVYDDSTDYIGVTTKKFEAQMSYLKEAGYTTITLDDLYNHYTNDTPLPKKPIVITFDDGYEDNYLYAYPILKKNKQKATIFLVTESMDKYIGTSQRLFWDEIRTMKKEGLIDFQSHTANHVNLLELSNDKTAIMKELKDSRNKIEQETGKKADYIAYPTGIYNKKVSSYCRQAGYKMGFTINTGFANKKDGLYNLNRIPIYNSSQDSMFMFKTRLELAPAVQLLETFRVELDQLGYEQITKELPVFE